MSSQVTALELLDDLLNKSLVHIPEMPSLVPNKGEDITIIDKVAGTKAVYRIEDISGPAEGPTIRLRFVRDVTSDDDAQRIQNKYLREV